MRVLTAEQTVEWFRAFENLGNKDEYVHAGEDELFYSHPEATCIDVGYPPKLEQLPSFAHSLATIGYEEQYFDGAFIWRRRWGIWSAFSESSGYRIVERMIAATGQPMSFEVACGYEFRADELYDAVGMLLQPMIFAWDAFYLPRWSYGTGEFFLYVSHDSYVTVAARTKELYDRAFRQLEKLNYNPKSAEGTWRTEHFCRRS